MIQKFPSEDLKFSVIMPTYNGSKWVGQTIKSILRQTCKNFELIVSDDCSTDNTLEIIRGIKNKSIKIFKNEKNLAVLFFISVSVLAGMAVAKILDAL